MRWFIALLLVANVILYFWVQQQSRPLPGTTELPPPDIGRLRLINEVDPQQGTVAADAAPTGDADGPDGDSLDMGSDMETLAEQTGAQAEMPAEVQTETQPEALAAVPSEDRAVRPLVEPAGAEQVPARPDAVAAVVSAAEVAVNADTDTDAASTAAPAQATLSEPKVAETVGALAMPAAEVEAVCARVGPFAAEEADKLIGGLPLYIRLLADVVEEQSIADGYYVLIPALPSRAAGQQKLKELADAGVKDIWLISTGDMRNAISLGYFKFEVTAKRRAADIVKKGFTVEFKENATVQELRWLHLKNLDGGDLRSVLPLPADVTVEKLACP